MREESFVGQKEEIDKQHLIARCIFPDILAFYESEEGQQEFAEWKAQQAEKSDEKAVTQVTD